MVKNNAVPKYDNDESKKDNDSFGCVPSLDEQWAGLGKNKNAARQAAGTEVECHSKVAGTTRLREYQGCG